MPVPVPRRSKAVCHPVVKPVNCGDGQTIPFQTLTRTLPVSPTGPPASFGTREQWINSLPTWRRTKPRRIWEDDARNADQRVEQGFCRGLTAAGNAAVIKGARAEASIPPRYALLEAGQLPTEVTPGRLVNSDGDADDEMRSDYSAMDRSHLENQSQWSASSPMGIDDGGMTHDASQARSPNPAPLVLTDLSYDAQSYERGAFSPVFEDQSPGTVSGPERDSSPLQPVTPFAVYVDRAVAAQPYSICVGGSSDELQPQGYNHEEKICGPRCFPTEPPYQLPAEVPPEPAPAPVPEVVTPCASAGYKKLAGPLADWVANYVWKVCTTGLSLPSTFARSSSMTTYANMPPSYLAASVHSLLLSTLLQPSAVFLAIWYIVRLPVYFAAAALGPEYVKEARFRVALLGDPYTGLDKESMEASAPFRLIVLGCMLANKWLDDHTFSNKTWHNISNVPIQALNKLESLTLDIFAYDLTITSRDWSQWLAHVMSYHMSLSSPTHPQPISRPSTNPHSIIRKAIEEIIQAPVAYDAFSVPQPVFIGIEERKKEKSENERSLVAEVLEIDLDEDGPLREEYLPKRRVNGAGSYRKSGVTQLPGVLDPTASHVSDWERRGARGHENSLPPPAKWSPAGDEPLHRGRDRATGQYVAVQPPLVHSTVSYPGLYHPPIDAYPYHWTSVAYASAKPQPTYAFDFPVVDNPGNQASYGTYPYIPQIAISHSRSQSLGYDPENLQSRHHMRSYSQSRFDYQCSDLRMTANEFAPQCQGQAAWLGANHHQYHAPAFAPIHNVHPSSRLDVSICAFFI
ncbi:putative cyclin [Lyophyllum shimeji]|uniref:Cyclin n=1 Tax=Lyophyllum shimeji TaxID=47721 RepID=A0A9P3PCW6_LYOSH|nr:putative cyclin [Lyophyllum shimeji]